MCVWMSDVRVAVESKVESVRTANTGNVRECGPKAFLDPCSSLVPTLQVDVRLSNAKEAEKT